MKIKVQAENQDLSCKYQVKSAFPQKTWYHPMLLTAVILKPCAKRFHSTVGCSRAAALRPDSAEFAFLYDFPLCFRRKEHRNADPAGAQKRTHMSGARWSRVGVFHIARVLSDLCAHAHAAQYGLGKRPGLPRATARWPVVWEHARRARALAPPLPRATPSAPRGSGARGCDRLPQNTAADAMLRKQKGESCSSRLSSGT